MAVDHRELTLPQGPPAVGGDTAGAPLERRGLWKDAYVRFTRNKAAVAAAAIFGAICLYCILVPIFSPYDPNEVKFRESYLPASLEHPFGTDKFGRDLFTRVAVGGRISIGIGFAGTIAILTVGVLYGSIAGFLGGMVDDVLMRVLDALYGLPYLPFAIITTQILSPNGEVTFWTMVAALTIASWFTTARIVRGQVTTLKQNEYVGAARAVGARWHRILRRHILPNTMGVLIIAVFLDLPAVVLGRRSSRSSASESTRPRPPGARSRRTDARPTSSTRSCFSFPASPSPRSSSAPTSSRTGCVTLSTRARGPRAAEDGVGSRALSYHRGRRRRQADVHAQTEDLGRRRMAARPHRRTARPLLLAPDRAAD
jgi:ABC-type dipeptide/oligopeptide/nickel transport system permease subunit